MLIIAQNKQRNTQIKFLRISLHYPCLICGYSTMKGDASASNLPTARAEI